MNKNGNAIMHEYKPGIWVKTLYAIDSESKQMIDDDKLFDKGC